MIDTRELLIIENTFDNMNLIEENTKLQNSFNTLLITVAILGAATVIIGLYLHNQKQKKTKLDSVTHVL